VLAGIKPLVLNATAMRRNCKRLLAIKTVILLVLLSVGQQLRVAADPASAPSLTISQLKITSSNGQFVTLYNTTDTALDMSKYQLEYFNHYDLSKVTSSRLVALTGTVPPHGYFMVNDSALLLCYRLTIDSVSLGFSSTAGMVELLAFNQTSAGGSALPVLQDYVGWSKTAAAGAQTLPASSNAFLQRQPTDSHNNPKVTSPGSGSWQNVQPDSGDACNLVSVTSTPTPIGSGLSQLLPSSEPPATIINVAAEPDGAVVAKSLPASDIGLMAPQITELLPNPNGTGTDADDEFIELYNANDKVFDLSGFSIQVGLTTTHKYTFSNGTNLPPKSFKAFYSSATGLTLSNTSGQSKLLDPLDNSIATTEAYSNAKDGQAWALAKGKWYWTASPTPGGANVIKQKAGSKKKTAGKKTAGSKTKTSKLKSKSAAGSALPTDSATKTPIHLRSLAMVAVLALLYGIYEYRADLANRLHQFRGHFRARRASRTETERR
jgi:hypothetical protein